MDAHSPLYTERETGYEHGVCVCVCVCVCVWRQNALSHMHLSSKNVFASFLCHNVAEFENRSQRQFSCFDTLAGCQLTM